MMVLRCTAKLLRRMKIDSPSEEAPSTGRLGDWYANVVRPGRSELALCVSERTLLPVLLPARDPKSVPERLRAGLSLVLRRIGVPEEALRQEVDHMDTHVVAKTASRHVLGSMTDFAIMLEARTTPISSLIDEALWLATAPCGPIDMRRPWDATVEALANPTAVSTTRGAHPSTLGDRSSGAGMGDTWITDMRHYLDVVDPAVELPNTLRRLALHQGSIVERVSSWDHGIPLDTGIACRRRPGRRPCPGHIFGWHEHGAVVWTCTRCNDNGRISGWRGTPWDRTPDAFH